MLCLQDCNQISVVRHLNVSTEVIFFNSYPLLFCFNLYFVMFGAASKIRARFRVNKSGEPLYFFLLRRILCCSLFLRRWFQIWRLSKPPVVYCTDRSKAVVPVLVFPFVALWFILRGDLLYIFPYVILFLCFSVLLVLRLPRFGKRELILVLFVRLLGFCLFRFVGFLFLLGSGKGFGLWLWHFLAFSLTFFVIVSSSSLHFLLPREGWSLYKELICVCKVSRLKNSASNRRLWISLLNLEIDSNI